MFHTSKSARRCTVLAVSALLPLGALLGAAPVAAAPAPVVAASDAAEDSGIHVESSLEVRAGEPVRIAGRIVGLDHDLRIGGLPGMPFLTPIPVKADGTFDHTTQRGFEPGVRDVRLVAGDGPIQQVQFRVADANGNVPELTPLRVTSPTTWTSGQALRLSGTATPGATVSLRVPNATGTDPVTTVGADGRWSVQTSRPLTGTQHEVTLTQSAPYGTATTRVTVTASNEDGSEASLRPLAVTSDPVFVPGKRLELAGTATPGAAIIVRALSADINQEITTVAADGTWKFTSSRPVGGEAHGVRVAQNHPLGHDVQEITVRASEGGGSGTPDPGPGTPDPGTPDPGTPDPGTDPTPEFDVTSDATWIVGEKVRLAGTGEPGALVNFASSDGYVSGKTTVGTDGRWSWESDRGVSGKRLTITVRQWGEKGLEARTVTLTGVDEGGSEAAFEALRVDDLDYQPFRPIEVTGRATPGAKVTVRNTTSGDSSGPVTVAADGTWKVVLGASSGLRVNLQVSQQAATGQDSVTRELTAPVGSGGLTFRPTAVTSDTAVELGGTTTLTGTASPWATITLQLENPGGKPVPGGNERVLRTTTDAEGRFSIEIPEHRLLGAVLSQFGALGSDRTAFEFTAR